MTLGALGRILLVALALASVSACAPTTAIVNGQVVPRPTIELTGNAYHVRHRNAHPRARGASSGLSSPGGDIVGRVCGMDIDFDVEHAGDRTRLVGFLEGSNWATAITVRDEGRERTITGNLGPLGVDLKLTSTGLIGHVGVRVLSTEVVGDDLVGFIRTSSVIDYRTGKPSAVRLTLHGRTALWDMQAAEQAAVVPTLLTCAWLLTNTSYADDLTLAFGGPAVDRPPQSSALYRRR